MTAIAFDIVRDVVMTKRRDGAKASFAVFEAAADLGVTPRWITSVLRNEPCAVKPSRAATLYRRYLAWLAADIAKHERLIAQRRARLREMEKPREMAQGADDECVAGGAGLGSGADS